LSKSSKSWRPSTLTGTCDLTKKKSEILTKEDLPEIGGIKCVKMVKYLGVRVTIDRKEQTQVTREQIDKNVKLMRWRLGRADSDVI
jgi:hypothetical protein